MSAEWIAVLLTLVGFLGSLVNALWARRERMAAAQSASDAHEVQESMAASQASIAAALERPAVDFEITTTRGHLRILRNTGQMAVTGLKVEWPERCEPTDRDPDPTHLEPGDGIHFGVTVKGVGEKSLTSLRVVCDQRPEGVRVPINAV